MTKLLLGIDGGGSKTRALLADLSGSILGVGSAGSSNYQGVGFEAAADSIRSAIAAAFHAAGHKLVPVAAACFGLAGVDRPADQVLFEEWLGQQAIAERFKVVNDAELVLAAGTSQGWGAALICGTGSICYGRSPDGRRARAGGWGHILGDEGSGYDIAIQALRLATKTVDGRAAATSILAAALACWGLESPDQLIGYIYRPETTRADVARLAGRIVALADAGDSEARTILDGALAELTGLISVVARKLDLVQPPIALGGGLVGASGYLQRGLVEHASVELGPLTYVDDPARGALVLARRLLERSASR